MRTSIRIGAARRLPPFKPGAVVLSTSYGLLSTVMPIYVTVRNFR